MLAPQALKQTQTVLSPSLSPSFFRVSMVTNSSIALPTTARSSRVTLEWINKTPASRSRLELGVWLRVIINLLTLMSHPPAAGSMSHHAWLHVVPRMGKHSTVWATPPVFQRTPANFQRDPHVPWLQLLLSLKPYLWFSNLPLDSAHSYPFLLLLPSFKFFVSQWDNYKVYELIFQPQIHFFS